MKKPNVLFFFTDDQRFDTIGALGNEAVHTPHLDEFAASGTAFTHAHIPGGTCPAVCMPSRAMLHTGRTLFHLQGEGQEIPEAHTTLGEQFRRAGYSTFGIGKWHNGRAAFARSFEGGDEIFFGGMGDHWNVPAYHFDPAGRYEATRPFIRDPYRSNTLEYRQCDHVTPGKHSTELFTEAALEFLRRRDAEGTERPFFLYVSLMAPHDPRTMPERFRTMYDPARIQLPENFMPAHPIDTGALRIRDELLAAFPRDPGEIRRHLAEYYGMISHLDDAFGRLMACLRARGELENTLIVFAGDNGLAVGQHGLMGKQNLYDHSLRVPLVFSGPGIPRGARTDAPAYLLDLFPTLCELTGLDTPASVEGRSLAPCIADPARRVRRHLYLAYADTIRGVKDERYKLIEYAGQAGYAVQLFDLVRDPHEMHNLAEDVGTRGIAARMRKQLLRLRDEWDDTRHPAGTRFWAQRRPA